MTPATREQFKNYCLRKLGQNVIDLNVDDDQVEDRIDEAIKYYRDFHHDATMRIYLPHQITANNITDRYIPVNENLIAVNRILPAGGSSGAGNINMFDLRYQLRLNDYLTFQIPTTLDLYLLNRQLSMIDEMYVGTPPIEFNRVTKRIYPYWDWDVDVTEGEYIIIEGLTAVDPDSFTDMWADRMLQKLATAYIKHQWGSNMSKFTSTKLFGGVEYNGQQIKDEAAAEIKEIEQEIRDAWEEPPRMIVG